VNTSSPPTPALSPTPTKTPTVQPTSSSSQTGSTPKPTPSPKPSPGGTQVRGYLTGYSGAGDDNSCGGHGGNCVAFEDIQAHAGGAGDFDHPITVAISEDEWRSGKYKPGQTIYFPFLRIYGIFSDYCGNSDNPDCSKHTDHFDIWTGENGSDACMNRLTGSHTAIVNPGRGYAVVAGPLDENGCHTFSDTVVMA
jgi:hypothetical protein